MYADDSEIDLMEALGVAIEAAEKAGRIIWQSIEKRREATAAATMMTRASANSADQSSAVGDAGTGNLSAQLQASATDLVTQCSKQCAEVITSILSHYTEDVQKEKPQLRFALVTKELNSSTPITDDYTWVFSPLDGTMSFVHGLPDCCVSIGLIHRKQPMLAVVFTPFITSGVRLTIAASAVLRSVQQQVQQQLAASSPVGATASADDKTIASGSGDASATPLATVASSSPTTAPFPRASTSAAAKSVTTSHRASFCSGGKTEAHVPMSSVTAAAAAAALPTMTYTSPSVVPECNGDLFTAIRGQGAYLNGRRLRVRAAATPASALVVLNLPCAVEQTAEEAAEATETEVMMRRQCRHADAVDCCAQLRADLARLPVEGLRCSGSAATTLAQTAAGRVDAYLEPDGKAWDVCAGSLLVTEAGGVVTNIVGDPFDVTRDTTIVASANATLAHLLTQKCVTHNYAQFWMPKKQQVKEATATTTPERE